MLECSGVTVQRPPGPGPTFPLSCLAAAPGNQPGSKLNTLAKLL